METTAAPRHRTNGNTAIHNSKRKETFSIFTIINQTLFNKFPYHPEIPVREWKEDYGSSELIETLIYTHKTPAEKEIDIRYGMNRNECLCSCTFRYIYEKY